MNFSKLKNYIKNLLSGTAFLVDDNLLLYLCGNEALPTPLDSETELEYIEKAEQGDESAKNKLIEHNLRLVVYIGKKFENTNVDLEDLISIGAIGLIKAVNSFKLEKNIKLATYASRCIENEILMHLRKTSRLKAEVSLDEPLTVDGDGNELVLADILSVDTDTVTSGLEKSTEKELLWNSIKKLNSKEREIMILRFGLNNSEEKTQKEVADMLGISQSYISRIEKKIVGKLKKELLKTI
jgi:RNA polymerase sporulation-specific sigma factor